MRPQPPLRDAATRALVELTALSNAPALTNVSSDQLLMERTQLDGLPFRSGRSAAGFCRFLHARDGTIALNLPRDSDWDLIPAWLETAPEQNWTWDTLQRAVAGRSARALIDQGRLLGLALAPTSQVARPAGFYRVACGDTIGAARRRSGNPLVVDLSALWAGPLSSHLLHLCGARVIKIESTQRPDGAREGNIAFYRLLNQAKRCVALDLTSQIGRQRLRELIGRADIVIEGSRPRALRQLGIFAESVVTRRSITWISINGYGRDEPEANWIAYGDDAGVAAGLSDVMKQATGRYEFAGDAIADPLTGIHAALIAWRSWQCGGGRLIDLPLTRVAAWCLNQSIERDGPDQVIASFGQWWRQARSKQPGPEPRAISEPTGALGEHTAQVLNDLEITC